MSDLPRIRSRPEDFYVEEIPLYVLSGEGEHTYVLIEKTLCTTEHVARRLATAAGVRPRDVGYAGRKDRNAVTRQWFSVPGLNPELARALEFPGAQVLEATLHGNKLRTGHLKGNQFRLVVRDVTPEVESRARERAATLAAGGMPNRYGSQRFGRDGKNARHGLALLRGESVPNAGDRRAKRFLLSALQSAVFNDVLAQRTVGLGVVEVGDVAILHSSGGMFVVEDLEREAPRAERFEISPTGPIFGTRMMEAAGEAGERERAVFESWELPENLKLPGIRLRGARRSLRARLDGLVISEHDDGLLIQVTLPPGGYVTVLLEELFGDFTEGTPAAVS
jgi:tRNA pseudouridine13 synthase